MNGERAGAGGDPPVRASCSDLAYHERSECPDQDDIVFAVERCEELRHKYEPAGCGAEYAQYVACRSRAPIDCATGEAADCPGSEVYGRCVSEFVRTTSCSRGEARDEACAQGTFFFSCLGAPPEGCEPLEEPSALGILACCPRFATSEHFDEPRIDPADLQP